MSSKSSPGFWLYPFAQYLPFRRSMLPSFLTLVLKTHRPFRTVLLIGQLTSSPTPLFFNTFISSSIACFHSSTASDSIAFRYEFGSGIWYRSPANSF